MPMNATTRPTLAPATLTSATIRRYPALRTGAAAVPGPLERLLVRAGLTSAEWEATRPLCRVGLRATVFGPAYRFVAVILPGGEYFNVGDGPNDAPGALAWWSRLLDVPAAETGAGKEDQTTQD